MKTYTATVTVTVNVPDEGEDATLASTRFEVQPQDKENPASCAAGNIVWHYAQTREFQKKFVDELLAEVKEKGLQA